MQHNNISGNGQDILRQSIDAAIESLGGPIYKTITWYLKSRGVLSDSKKIDINFFYSNLQELLGPGADLIMEETLQHLQKRYGGAKAGHEQVKRSALERIQKMIEVGEA